MQAIKYMLVAAVAVVLLLPTGAMAQKGPEVVVKIDPALALTTLAFTIHISALALVPKHHCVLNPSWNRLSFGFIIFIRLNYARGIVYVDNSVDCFLVFTNHPFGFFNGIVFF